VAAKVAAGGVAVAAGQQQPNSKIKSSNRRKISSCTEETNVFIRMLSKDRILSARYFFIEDIFLYLKDTLLF